MSLLRAIRGDMPHASRRRLAVCLLLTPDFFSLILVWIAGPLDGTASLSIRTVLQALFSSVYTVRWRGTRPVHLFLSHLEIVKTFRSVFHAGLSVCSIIVNDRGARNKKNRRPPTYPFSRHPDRGGGGGTLRPTLKKQETVFRQSSSRNLAALLWFSF